MINAAKPGALSGWWCDQRACGVRELAEKAQLPTMTLMALGMLPKAHPLSLGMLGMHGVRSTNYILQEADLLIVLGARFDDRAIGKTEQFCPNAKNYSCRYRPRRAGQNQSNRMWQFRRMLMTCWRS